jgi:hypothetical protein
MDKYLGVAWVAMLVLKAIWILIVPTIVTVAACKLWHSVPRWISIAFLVSAVISVVTSIPQFLIMLHGLTPQQYGKIAIPLVVTGGIARIASAIALLALAIRLRTMTEQGGGEVRV